MGIYDRDYTRDEPKGIFLGGERSMVTNLIIINIGLYLLDTLFLDRQIARYLRLEPGLGSEHWRIWQLLTYGFIHDAQPFHILFNMLTLWFFGREVEGIYGRKEFLRLYLMLIVAAGAVTLLVQQLVRDPASVVGASGAIVGVLVIFVCHDPRRTILVWGVLPVPGWVLATFYILVDVAGFSQVGSGAGMDGRTAFETHLAGAAFGYMYYRSGWNLGRLVPGWLSSGSLARRPKLKIRSAEIDERDLNERVDEILEKLYREGEASLTKQERKTLEDASRRLQRRRR